jgi:hypothetical protein
VHPRHFNRPSSRELRVVSPGKSHGVVSQDRRQGKGANIFNRIGAVETDWTSKQRLNGSQAVSPSRLRCPGIVTTSRDPRVRTPFHQTILHRSPCYFVPMCAYVDGLPLTGEHMREVTGLAVVYALC